MTNRERILAVLNYEPYDRLPVIHFGFLASTIERWTREGHIDPAELDPLGDGLPGEAVLDRKLGFDCNYHRTFRPANGLFPGFAGRVLEELPGGYRKVLRGDGAIVLDSDDNQSISPHVDHLLKGRTEWDAEFVGRLQYSDERVERTMVNCDGTLKRFDQGGREYLARDERSEHVLLHCGSLYGDIRNWVGVENLCYLQVDDEKLYDEMIEVNAELCYRCTEHALASGARFDIGHFWEDICFKNGPLVNPAVFAQKVGPHYKQITALLAKHGIDLVSLDCDGWIDALVSTWVKNGVNVMFPIEVGTWNASIAPWREAYGKAVRGVGGMAKRVLAYDYAAIDAEIERLKPLVELGGFLPCPDHRLPHDCKWENVQYYCDQMRQTFGG
jgi:uroporphyrinogen decarboxylase